jgi:hypothetical protein
MGKQLDQITQIDRQIKTLAMQQGEKDIDKVTAQNSELEKRKGSLLNEVLRAQAKIEAKKAGGQTANPFGNSLDGRIMNAFATLGPKVEDGTATPMEARILSLAKDKWTQPTLVPIIDPVEKTIMGYREVRKELPSIVSTGGPTRPSAPTSQVDPGAPTDQVDIIDQSGPTRPIGPQGAPAPAEGEGFGSSLWGDRYLVSGPLNAAKDVASQIPGLGAPFSDVAVARQRAKQQAERVVEALLKSAQGSVREQERLAPVIGIVPDAMRGGDAYGNKVIALGMTLRDMITEFEKQGKEGSGLKPEDKGLARKKASEYRQHYDNLGLPPAVYSQQEADKYPPGTELLWDGRVPIRRQNRITGGN